MKEMVENIAQNSTMLKNGWYSSHTHTCARYLRRPLEFNGDFGVFVGMPEASPLDGGACLGDVGHLHITTDAQLLEKLLTKS